MAATPRDIAVDIHDLLTAGRQQLPAVASQYAKTADGLNIGTVGFAMMRDASLGLGSTGAFSQWADCLNAVTGMLDQERSTMQQIGDALVDIALREFQDTDEAVRSTFGTMYGKINR